MTSVMGGEADPEKTRGGLAGFRGEGTQLSGDRRLHATVFSMAGSADGLSDVQERNISAISCSI